MIDVGKKVRDTRRAMGLTQADLARLAGSTQSAIARMENGGRSPSFSTVDRIMAAMGKGIGIVAFPLDAVDVGVDRSLIVSNLRASPAERLRRLREASRFVAAVRKGRRLKG